MTQPEGQVQRHWWDRLCPFRWSDERHNVWHQHHCRMIGDGEVHQHACDCGERWHDPETTIVGAEIVDKNIKDDL